MAMTLLEFIQYCSYLHFLQDMKEDKFRSLKQLAKLINYYRMNIIELDRIHRQQKYNNYVYSDIANIISLVRTS